MEYRHETTESGARVVYAVPETDQEAEQLREGLAAVAAAKDHATRMIHRLVSEETDP